MKRYRLLFEKVFKDEAPSTSVDIFAPEDTEPMELYEKWAESHNKFFEDFYKDLIRRWESHEDPEGYLRGLLVLEDWDEDGEYEVIETLTSIKYDERSVFHILYPDWLDED